MKETMFKCPYNKAVKCNLKESCFGCETFAEYNSSERSVQPEVMDNTCEWLAIKITDSYMKEYDTDCGNMLYVTPDTIEDWKYCPFCGKKINMKEYITRSVRYAMKYVAI